MADSNRKLIALDVRTKHSDPVQFLKDMINKIESGAYSDVEQIALAIAFKGDRETLSYSYHSNGLRHDELFFLFEMGEHALLHGEKI